MSLELDWIGVTAKSTTEVLWYLSQFPPSESITNGKNEISVPRQKPLNVSLPPKPFVADMQVPRMFAITIGINDYTSSEIPNLTGAVADADGMSDFLAHTLQIPLDHITNLRDSSATREGIEGAISALADDERIQNGDPILIFYAGHGAEVVSPPGWRGERKIQMLLPHDFIPQSTGSGNRGQGVLDIRLDQLLERLAERKGNNITVILDTCYSGSGARHVEKDPTFSVRGIELCNYQVAPDLLDVLSSSQAGGISRGPEKLDPLPYVIISACKEDQTAKEWKGRGAFTQALLSLWRKEGVDLLTYNDVILRLRDLPIGYSSFRGLFNSLVRPRRNVYTIRRKGANLYIIDAGDAHGITPGAHFTIYADLPLTSPLGKVKAKKTIAFQTALEPIPGQTLVTFDGPAYAIQTSPGEGCDVKFLMPLDKRLLPIMAKIKDEMQKEDAAEKRIVMLVDEESSSPDLVVSLTKGPWGQDEAVFNITDPTCRHYGLTQMPLTSHLDIGPLTRIFRTAADFYWKLNRSSNLSLIAPKVKLSCYKLKPTGEYDDNLEEIMEPDMDAGDFNLGGTIFVNVNETIYGFSIKNTSPVPLYVSVFYFDMSDLSISSFYEPGVTIYGRVPVKPSIPPGGELTVGYGGTDTFPRYFYLRDNQTVDVGFIKLFLSTAYVDYSSVTQDSPFGHERSEGNKPKTRQVWDTVKIAIVQK